jgi:hypothetical protein
MTPIFIENLILRIECNLILVVYLGHVYSNKTNKIDSKPILCQIMFKQIFIFKNVNFCIILVMCLFKKADYSRFGLHRLINFSITRTKNKKKLLK